MVQVLLSCEEVMLSIDAMPVKTKSTPSWVDKDEQFVGTDAVIVKTKARAEELVLAADIARLFRLPSITRAEPPESEKGNPISGSVRFAEFAARSEMVPPFRSREFVEA